MPQGGARICVGVRLGSYPGHTTIRSLVRTGVAGTTRCVNEPVKNTKTTTTTEGQRLETFSYEDVVEHARQARPKRRPIWTNPFHGERAALWRKAWRRPHDREVR